MIPSFGNLQIVADDEEHSQDWKEGTTQDRRERQTLPLRQVPQTQPEADEDSRPLVLSGLPQRDRHLERDDGGLIAVGVWPESQREWQRRPVSCKRELLMRDQEELFAALARSKFRSRFRLGTKEASYLREKTLTVVLEHGRRFITERLAEAEPKHDGRQTPMRGHPIFVAQHATATCCRSCLAKWHRIPQSHPLTLEQVDYILAVLARWLTTPLANLKAVTACRNL